MGKLFIIIGVISSIISFLIGGVIFWISLVTTALVLWTYGVMHNFAMDSAKKWKERVIENKRIEGALEEEIERIQGLSLDITSGDLKSVPDWLTQVNMILSLTIVIIFIVSLIMTF